MSSWLYPPLCHPSYLRCDQTLKVEKEKARTCPKDSGFPGCKRTTSRMGFLCLGLGGRYRIHMSVYNCISIKSISYIKSDPSNPYNHGILFWIDTSYFPGSIPTTAADNAETQPLQNIMEVNVETKSPQVAVSTESLSPDSARERFQGCRPAKKPKGGGAAMPSQDVVAGNETKHAAMEAKDLGIWKSCLFFFNLFQKKYVLAISCCCMLSLLEFTPYIISYMWFICVWV